MMFRSCKCVYCRKYGGFPVLWNLDDGKLWFEVPKNGSAVIKSKYGLKWESVSPNNPPTPLYNYSEHQHRTPYVVLRDPIDRFVSLYRHYFIEGNKRFPKGADFFGRCGYNITNMKHKDRFDLLIKKLDRLTTEEEVHHFYPQTAFIDLSFPSLNLVKMSEISSVFGVSGNAPAPWDFPGTNEDKAKIHKIYQTDYDFFNRFNFKP